ncbi:MAG: hypothetical protein ACRD2W_10960 [Acidimicrobiales bacterium]
MDDRFTSSPPVVLAGIYTRISYDPAGLRAGVERQRLDCEALCRSRGWKVAKYLEDYADARVMPTPQTKRLVKVLSWRNLSA